jgi:hypothetical protein
LAPTTREYLTVGALSTLLTFNTRLLAFDNFPLLGIFNFPIFDWMLNSRSYFLIFNWLSNFANLWILTLADLGRKE